MTPKILSIALMCLALTACRAEEATEIAPPAAHDHSSMAAHGGSIIELGDHVAIVEIVQDEAAGVVTAYVMDAQGGALAADAAPVLNVPADEPMQLTGVEKDGAWTFTDESLKGHVHGARMRITIGGKTFNPELPDVH